MAKMVDFGLAYGMSDFGLSSRPGISQAGGAGVHHRLLRRVQRHQPLHAPHPGNGGGAGYVATLLGRKPQIPELTLAEPALKAAGERMAINMPIQGTAADIVKIAMIRTDRALREGGFRARVLCPCTTTGARGAAGRGAAGADPARGDGGRPDAVGAADRRCQGRRLLGGHDAGLAADAVLAEADEVPEA